MTDSPGGERQSVLAVSTTNVFCVAGCPARAPLPHNADWLDSPREALFSGYRPCLRCRPLDRYGGSLTPAARARADSLRSLLASARRARRRRSGSRAAVLRLLRTPLGPMLAAATDEGICLLEFADRPMLPTQLWTLEHRLRRPLVTGAHPLLATLEAQLGDWFAGRRQAFDLPLVAPGTPFQERVWSVLRSIPSGSTISYEELAERSGRPGAQRAAGTANGANRVALLIPCHRVVRKSGETGNYGGGRWRKAWLLAHERDMVAESSPLHDPLHDGGRSPVRADLSAHLGPESAGRRRIADLSGRQEPEVRPGESLALALDR